MKPEIIKKLEELGFKHNDQNKGRWEKTIDDNKVAYWDFRKKPNGHFYVGIPGGDFEPQKNSYDREEYTSIREIQGQRTLSGQKTSIKKPVQIIQPTHHKTNDNGNETSLMLPRINEANITTLISKHDLQIIAEASKDGQGEGVLYHKLPKNLGCEPSAELIDMITVYMGGIQTEIIEQGTHVLTHPVSDESYLTYYAIVRATDTLSGTTGIGSAEELIDFNDFENGGKSFALTNAIRKAERNAKIRIIPVPKSALVTLVQKQMATISKNKKEGN